MAVLRVAYNSTNKIWRCWKMKNSRWTQQEERFIPIRKWIWTVLQKEKSLYLCFEIYMRCWTFLKSHERGQQIPAVTHLFEVNLDSTYLPTKESNIFHQMWLSSYLQVLWSGLTHLLKLQFFSSSKGQETYWRWLMKVEETHTFIGEVGSIYPH